MNFPLFKIPCPPTHDRMKISNLYFNEFHAYFSNSSKNSATLSPQPQARKTFCLCVFDTFNVYMASWTSFCLRWLFRTGTEMVFFVYSVSRTKTRTLRLIIRINTQYSLLLRTDGTPSIPMGLSKLLQVFLENFKLQLGIGLTFLVLAYTDSKIIYLNGINRILCFIICKNILLPPSTQ